MRLLIDTVNVSSPGAVQLQIELARSVAVRRPADWDIVYLKAPEGAPIEPTESFRVVTESRAGSWRKLQRWFDKDLPDRVRDLDVHVVYSLSGFLSEPLRRVCGAVSSINNMLPFAPRLVREYPLFSRGRLKLRLLRHMYVRSARMADALVLPSRFGLETVRAHAGRLPEGSFVGFNPIPEYVRFDPDRPPAHPYGGRPFMLYLSVIRPYKNHLNLIEAYRRASTGGRRPPDLIIAGPGENPRQVERIRRAIAEASLTDRVKYAGLLPRAELPGWFHHAAINLFPSLCETNSFVQCEILGARGVMACSDLPPMPEIAGGAAELFDPLDPDSIAAAMARLLGDERRREELRRLAGIRAAGLTPETCGEEIWKAVLHARRRFEERTGR
jgi:glycosyltransferase involved in cell wall biosynthesis